MPAAIQRFFIVPSRQCFTRPVVVRTIEIIDSMQFVFVNDAAQPAGDAEAGDGEHLLEALRAATPAASG